MLLLELFLLYVVPFIASKTVSVPPLILTPMPLYASSSEPPYWLALSHSVIAFVLSLSLNLILALAFAVGKILTATFA